MLDENRRMRLRQRRRRRDARLPVRRGAARHAPPDQLRDEADYFGEDGSPLEAGRVPDDAARSRGEDPGPVLIRVVNRNDRRGALAADEVARRARLPRPAAARGQRRRGRHGAPPQRARAEAARAHGRGAGLVDRLREDAQGGRGPRRAGARGLVRGLDARPAGDDPPGRRRPQRPVEGRVRPRVRQALPVARQRRDRLRADPARRAVAADPARSRTSCSSRRSPIPSSASWSAASACARRCRSRWWPRAGRRPA